MRAANNHQSRDNLSFEQRNTSSPGGYYEPISNNRDVYTPERRPHNIDPDYSSTRKIPLNSSSNNYQRGGTTSGAVELRTRTPVKSALDYERDNNQSRYGYTEKAVRGGIGAVPSTMAERRGGDRSDDISQGDMLIAAKQKRL